MMKAPLIILALLHLGMALDAQYVYTIKADSVRITNCDSSELIIENHTQNVPGFLFNTGNGRTIFKHALQPLGGNTYLIGTDTLNMSKAWIQGGNAFGATGILGTTDNSHLDLYTGNNPRMRLTASGRILVGTTADDSTHLLQVNGASAFAGDMNIGSATITHTGSLIGTNAILQYQMMPETDVAWGRTLFISKLDNILYNYQNRFDTSSSVDPDGTYHLDIHFPPGEISSGYAGLSYGGGSLYLSFYYQHIPASVSVMLKDSVTGTWLGPYSSSANLSQTGFGFFRIDIPGINYISELNIAAKPGSDGTVSPIDVEYVIDRPEGLINPFPYVSKTANEWLYNTLYFRNNRQDYIRLSPVASAPSYFVNHLLVGSNADNGVTADKLQVSGNIVATGNLGLGTTSPAAQLHTTGSVRFAGLTQDSTQTRVLVSDASGNLYTRSVSSLADADIPRSSLTVNGTIKSNKIIISPDGWADYVFDSTYRLPPLADVGRYIQQEHHLPGIPSAAEVKKDSLDVGAGQAALLKKIEELTLYAIGQDKEIQVLKNEVLELKQLIQMKSSK